MDKAFLGFFDQPFLNYIMYFQAATVFLNHYVEFGNKLLNL